VLAVLLVLGLAAFLAHTSRELLQPLGALQEAPISLDPAFLPEYAARTTLRMLAAMLLSLLFTFTYAAAAAKSRRAELVLIPVLDILQSVPILGFISITIVFFMSLAPGLVLGAEFASIFAIFTSQAWNMAFSFYQSLRTVPEELLEATRCFHFTPWMRFWRVEVPFAMPALVWNMMVSMSGGWFFVVASEAITVGDTTVNLPGIGSWIALAIDRQNLGAVAQAVGIMALVILAYDQLLFRPIVAWADKFKFEQTAAQQRPSSWVYDLIRRTKLLRRAVSPLAWAFARVSVVRIPVPKRGTRPLPAVLARASDAAWFALVIAGTSYALWLIVSFVHTTLGAHEVLTAVSLGLLTLARVVVLIAIASAIWVPIGVWIGLRPWAAERAQPIAQFLAAFPANVVFPIAVVGIVTFRLDPNIWLSPLMVLGTQWYILFNVIAGASAFPTDLREAATLYRLRSAQWWQKVIVPGILPYYVTGALTATGGCWNASIVAEVASWGTTKLKAAGLGAYIATATDAGDYPRVVLGIAVMSVFVIAVNRLLWRPLYRVAEERYRLS
jgi:NitT/TauT family transport system permease protein